jgi:DNA gyrase subunit A
MGAALINDCVLQRRGGIGKTGGKLKDDDSVNIVLTIMAHDNLVIIANNGSCFSLRAFDVPERSRTAQGSPIGELLPKLPAGVDVSTIVPMRENTNKKRSLLLLSTLGKVKRLDLSAVAYASFSVLR